jgi:hypothetical protein
MKVTTPGFEARVLRDPPSEMPPAVIPNLQANFFETQPQGAVSSDGQHHWTYSLLQCSLSLELLVCLTKICMLVVSVVHLKQCGREAAYQTGLVPRL